MGKGLHYLFRPVDSSSLAVFRMAFGLLMLWEAWRYLHDGWVSDLWIEPEFHFSYPLFEWVRPWPGNGLIWQFYVMGGLAASIGVGFLYRACTVFYCLAFTYVFLLDAAYFLNHFYLIAIISFLLVFLPANARYSLDARLLPQLHRRFIPAWTVGVLRFQMALPYAFGGLAKLNGDWLQGQPMQLMLSAQTNVPIVGPWLDRPWVAYALSYSGLAIDLAAVPLLLHRKSRPYMFAILLMFHFTNSRLFDIGVFPWFAIAATTIFFDPDWPQQIWQRLQTSPRARIGFGVGAIVGAIAVWGWSGQREVVPLAIGVMFTGITGEMLVSSEPIVTTHPQRAGEVRTQQTEAISSVKLGKNKPPQRQMLVGLLLLWAIVQLSLPLRHYFIPGNASWTEEGHQFAWRMMLRSKDGWAVFQAVNPDNGAEAAIDPLEVLHPWQYQRMLQNPHFIHQYALYLETLLQDAGISDPKIYARTHLSLNDRPPQLAIDPAVDLTEQPLNRVPAPWIVPLQDGSERSH